jgi:hypothetical protein
MVRQFLRRFWKAFAWSLAISGGLFFLLELIPGFLLFVSLFKSETVVDINMSWLVENAFTPVFYFVIFTFILYCAFIVVMVWGTMDYFMNRGKPKNMSPEELHQIQELNIQRNFMFIREDISKIKDEINELKKKENQHENTRKKTEKNS